LYPDICVTNFRTDRPVKLKY